MQDEEMEGEYVAPAEEMADEEMEGAVGDLTFYTEAGHRYARASRRLDEAEVDFNNWVRANVRHDPEDPEYRRRQQNVTEANRLFDTAERRLNNAMIFYEQQSKLRWTRSSRTQLLVNGNDRFLQLPISLLDGTGIGRSGEPLVLYCRPSLLQQWNEMRQYSDQAHSLLLVSGPPGTGKSCTALAFASSLNRSLWNVVWVHYSQFWRVINCVWLRGNARATCIIKQTTVARDLRVILNSTLNTQKTIVFLDGYVGSSNAVEEALQECKHWHLEDEENHRVVCVYSMVAAGGEYCPDMCEQIYPTGVGPVKSTMEFYVPSWKFDEYKEAIMDDGLFGTVKSNFPSYARQEITEDEQKERMKLLQAKYFMTGGNARLMFDVTTEDAAKSLDVAICKVPDIEKYFYAFVGVASPDVVNQLFAWYGHSDFRLVSGYVVRKLAAILGPRLIQNFARICNVNSSMDGFLLEAWFFAELSHNGVTYSRYVSSKLHRYTWAKSNIIFFDSDKYPISVPLTFPTWMAPVKWNQGGYDAVFVNKGTKSVRFVQVTRAERHSFNPIYFVMFLNRLIAGDLKQVARVGLVFVVPNSRLAKFKLPVSKQDFETKVLEVALSDARASRSRADKTFENCRVEIMAVGVDYDVATCRPVEGSQICAPSTFTC